MVEMTIPPFKTTFSMHDLVLPAMQSFFHTAESMGIPILVGCIWIFIYCSAAGGGGATHYGWHCCVSGMNILTEGHVHRCLLP